MKVIGLGFDISSGVMPLPSVTDYMAYIFNAGNVIFGPWISFQDFKSIYSTNVSKCLVSDREKKRKKRAREMAREKEKRQRGFMTLCIKLSMCVNSLFKIKQPLI